MAAPLSVLSHPKTVACVGHCLISVSEIQSILSCWHQSAQRLVVSSQFLFLWLRPALCSPGWVHRLFAARLQQWPDFSFFGHKKQKKKKKKEKKRGLLSVVSPALILSSRLEKTSSGKDVTNNSPISKSVALWTDNCGARGSHLRGKGGYVTHEIGQNMLKLWR